MLHDAMREVGGPMIFSVILPPQNSSWWSKPTVCHAQGAYRSAPGESLEYFYRDQDRQAGVFEGMRLAVSMRELVGKPVAFENVDSLKSYLMQLVRAFECRPLL